MKTFRLSLVPTTAVALFVGFVLGAGITWLLAPLQRNRPAATTVGDEKKPSPGSHLRRVEVTLRFRVEDAVNHEPIGLARIVIDNVNLASELGADSMAVTWSDGCAKFIHRFFLLTRSAGLRSRRRSFFRARGSAFQPTDIWLATCP